MQTEERVEFKLLPLKSQLAPAAPPAPPMEPPVVMVSPASMDPPPPEARRWGLVGLAFFLIAVVVLSWAEHEWQENYHFRRGGFGFFSSISVR